jgi:predicted RNase H-like HicB family nuclease
MVGRVFVYTVIFEPRLGGYDITVPAFPFISAHGKTLEEARVIADAIIRIGIADSRRLGEPPPLDSEGMTRAPEGAIRERITVDLDAAPAVDVKNLTVGSIMATATPWPPEPRQGDPRPREFTSRALKVLKLAKKKAIERGHPSIGTEHLLLGILDEGSGVAANVLRAMGADLRQIHTEIEASMAPGVEPPTRAPYLGHGLPEALRLAHEESHRLGHEQTGTEHLLLGLIAQGRGIAARVLTNLGIGLEATRRAVMDFISPASGRDESAVGMPFIGSMGGPTIRVRGSLALRLAFEQSTAFSTLTPRERDRLASEAHASVLRRIASFPPAAVTWQEQFELHTQVGGDIDDAHARALIEQHLRLPGLTIDATGSTPTEYAAGPGWYERRRRYALRLGDEPWHETIDLDGITTVRVPIQVELAWRIITHSGK